MHKIYRILLAVIISCAIVCIFPFAAFAEGSSTGHAFCGTVKNNGKIVGAGYVVTGVINGQEVASAVTNEMGRWGDGGTFVIYSVGCAKIEFYVNGILAGSAASCIAANELPLSVNGAPSPSSYIAGSSTSTTNNTSNSSNTSSSNGQTTASSGSSNVIQSSSGTTFIIGQQTSSANNETAQSIECKLPGTQKSIILNKGVLSEQTKLVSLDNFVELDFSGSTAIMLSSGRQIKVVPVMLFAEMPPDSDVVAAYSFEPDNTTFSPSVTVRLRYDPKSLPDGMNESSLYIAQLLTTGEWKALPSTLNRAEGTVSAELSHFSTYALIGELGTMQEVVIPSAGSADSGSNSGNSNFDSIINNIKTSGDAGKNTIFEMLSVKKVSAFLWSIVSPYVDRIVQAVLALGCLAAIALFIAIIRRPNY